MRNKIVLCFYFLLPSAIWALDQQDTNREILQTYVNYFINRGQLGEAEQKIIDHLESDQGDSKRWLLLSLVQLKQKKLPASKESAERALEEAPESDKGRYYYHYADVLNRMGQMEEAQKQLTLAQDYPTSEDSADLALRSLEKGKPLPRYVRSKRGIWTLGVSLQGGYDSNVLLLSDSTLDTISRSNTESGFATLAAQGSYRYPLWSGQFAAGLQSRFTWYNESAAADFNAWNTQANLLWKTKIDSDFEFQIQNTSRLGFLNSSGFGYFNFSDSLGPSLSYDWNEWTRSTFGAELRYQHYANETLTDARDNRTGTAFGPSLNQEFRFDRVRTSLGFAYERNITEGNNFNANIYRSPLQLIVLLPWRLLSISSFQYTHTRYIDSTDNRKDTNYLVGSGLARRWTSELSTILNYSFIRNTSNLSSSRYDKHIIGLSVNYALF